MRRRLFDVTATDATSCVQLLGQLMDLARNGQLDAVTVMYWPRRSEGGKLPMRHALAGWVERRPADAHFGAAHLMASIIEDTEV